SYGGRRKLASGALSASGEDAVRKFNRQALHAAVLGFKHPTNGRSCRFEAELPEDMRGLFAALQPDLK
ncbi:MAG: RNA pseudouridine synthase, partial [Pseudomonadota bacterium]